MTTIRVTDVAYTMALFQQERIAFVDLINLSLRWQLTNNWPTADGFDSDGNPWFYRSTCFHWWESEVAKHVR